MMHFGEKIRALKAIGSVALLALVLVLTSVPAISVPTIIDDQIKVEDHVRTRLNRYLKELVSPDDYRLIISCDLKKFRKKVINAGEEHRFDQKNGETSQPIAHLPGFQKPDEDPVTKSSKADIKTAYTFVNQIKINQVHVSLIVTDRVEASTLDLIKSLMTKDLTASFGKKYSLDIRKSALTSDAPKAEADLESFFMHYLNDRGGDKLDLFYLLFMGFVSLMALYFLLKHALISWRRMRLAKKDGLDQKPLGGDLQDFGAADAAVDSIVSTLLEQSLTVKKFLKDLSPDNKKALLGAIRTKALKSYLCQLMAPVPDDDGSEGDTDVEMLKHLEIELSHYLKIARWQMERRFGFFNVVDDKTLFEIFPFETLMNEGQIGDLALVSRFLTTPQYHALLNRMNSDLKARFLAEVQSKAIDHERLITLEKTFRTMFDDASKTGLIDCRHEADLRHELFEQTLEVDELLTAMKERNLPVTEELKAYAISFSELLDQTDEILVKVLQRLDNDVLAKAYARIGISERLASVLGQGRAKFVGGVSVHFRDLEDEAIKSAQLEVMRCFRKASLQKSHSV